MLDKFRVVNPTEYVVGNAMPDTVGTLNRVIARSESLPTHEDLHEIASQPTVLQPYDGYAQNGRGWMQTKPSERLIVQQQRGLRVGNLSMPLGWKIQYEATVQEILAA